MLTTVLTLLLAHLIADYPLQTNWIVANKHRPAVMARHIGIVFVATLVALRGDIVPALTLSAMHLIIDVLKTRHLPDRLETYLADQGAHLLSIGALFLIFPHISDIWPASTDAIRDGLAICAGLITCVLMGGPAVGKLMDRFETPDTESLPNAGRTIGYLERAVIFLMVLTGQAAGIGFLIAAKSILRFDTVSQNKAIGEYVIIGTLASFGWALLISFVTVAVISEASIFPIPS